MYSWWWYRKPSKHTENCMGPSFLSDSWRLSCWSLFQRSFSLNLEPKWINLSTKRVDRESWLFSMKILAGWEEMTTAMPFESEENGVWIMVILVRGHSHTKWGKMWDMLYNNSAEGDCRLTHVVFVVVNVRGYHARSYLTSIATMSADPSIFLFTSESVNEGHPGTCKKYKKWWKIQCKPWRTLHH